MSRAGARRPHPDLTWVTPSGAAEMLVADIEEPVVAAATRTPFESARRVFVIEAVDTMNDQAANRMLKTLEEPPAFAHLMLLTDRREDVLATIASRCQHVRFDPLPAARRSPQMLAAEGCADGASERAGVRAPGAGRRGPGGAPGERGGRALRAGAEEFVRCGARGRDGERARGWSCWRSPGGGGERGRAARTCGWTRRARAAARARSANATSARRGGAPAGERRARTRTLDLGAAAWPSCGCATCCACGEGARELIYAVDRARRARAGRARLRRRRRRAQAIELVRETRALSLALNVSEELALEALAYRLQALAAGCGGPSGRLGGGLR